MHRTPNQSTVRFSVRLWYWLSWNAEALPPMATAILWHPVDLQRNRSSELVAKTESRYLSSRYISGLPLPRLTFRSDGATIQAPWDCILLALIMSTTTGLQDGDALVYKLAQLTTQSDYAAIARFAFLIYEMSESFLRSCWPSRLTIWQYIVFKKRFVFQFKMLLSMWLMDL